MQPPVKLTHEQVLKWIYDQRAWRLARKTRPIWARPLEPLEIGKEFQTADHVKQVAKEGYWLCVGVAGEPWFQAPEKVRDKYEAAGEEQRQFTFDSQRRAYQVFRPRADVQNWAAQVNTAGAAGFFIKPNYDPQRPLYSPMGGYVVKEYVADPYRDAPSDVWLVQQSLFESTYQIAEQ